MATTSGFFPTPAVPDLAPAPVSIQVPPPAAPVPLPVIFPEPFAP